MFLQHVCLWVSLLIKIPMKVQQKRNMKAEKTKSISVQALGTTLHYMVVLMPTTKPSMNYTNVLHVLNNYI